MNTETDLHNIVEGTAKIWRISLQDTSANPLPLENFAIYGAASAPGESTRAFSVDVDPAENLATVTMPGLPLTDEPWRYQIFARERSSHVEWLLHSGSVYLISRLAAPVSALHPSVDTVAHTLHPDTVTTPMEIGENMASISQNTAKTTAMAAAAESSAASARAQALDAAAWATRADAANTNAGNSATAAAQSAQSASGSASGAGSSAAAAAESAAQASASASTASQKAENAATSAAVAAAKAQITIDNSQASLENAERAEERAVEAASAARDAATSATAAETQATAAAQSAQAAAESAAQARESAVQVGVDQAERAQAYANEAQASAVEAAEVKRQLLELTAGSFYGTSESVPGGKFITDDGMDFIFSLIREQYGHVDEVYGVEWPAWPDLANSTGGPSVTVGGIGYGQHVPWNQPLATTPETYIHKLRDNAGLVGHFHRQGLDTGEERDDYENRPFFMDWRCNYVYDVNGDRRVTAIYGSPSYQEDGDVDVGILSMAYWIKYEKTINTDPQRYPQDRYATLYEKFGGVPVHRVFVSLMKPAGEEGWHYCSAGVRHDGSHAPYIVHTPYLSGWKNGKLRSQPGLQAVNGVSYSTLYGYYENVNSTAYKGGGSHGGTMELYAWAWLNIMLKYGAKSSQVLCAGIDAINNIYPALEPENESATLVVASGDAATLVPGMQVAIRRTYNNGSTNVYDPVTGYGGSTESWDSSSRYITPRKGARILSKSLRADGRYDITLDTTPMPLASTPITRWAFADSVSGAPLSETLDYDSAQASNPPRAFYRTTDLKDGRGNVKRYPAWVRNPTFDPETGTEGSYFPLYSSWNTYRYANLLNSYKGNATWNKYEYVPVLVQYEAKNRIYIQPAFPSSGQTDIIYKHRDGCIGYPLRPWSPFRIRMCEFGQGLYDLVTDAVGLSYTVDGSIKSHLFMAPKGGQGTRSNDFGTMKASWINQGEKMNVGDKWPAEFIFHLTGGDVNHGTEELPKYANSTIYPAPDLTYVSPGSGGNGYGDYYYCSNANNAAYEILLGGSCLGGANCGLLCVNGSVALGNAYWNCACRD